MTTRANAVLKIGRSDEIIGKGKPLDILLLQSTKGKVPLALYLYEGKLVLNCVKPESTIDSILKSV